VTEGKRECAGGGDITTLTLTAFAAEHWRILSVGDGRLDEFDLGSDMTIHDIL
jgi:hypothetical protein